MVCEPLRRLIILPSGNKTAFNGWSLPRFNAHIKVKNRNKKCSDWISGLWRVTLPDITSSPLRCPSGQKHRQHREWHQRRLSESSQRSIFSKISAVCWTFRLQTTSPSSLTISSWRRCSSLVTTEYLFSIDCQQCLSSYLYCWLHPQFQKLLVTLGIIYSFKAVIHTDLTDPNLQNESLKIKIFLARMSGIYQIDSFANSNWLKRREVLFHLTSYREKKSGFLYSGFSVLLAWDVQIITC